MRNSKSISILVFTQFIYFFFIFVVNASIELLMQKSILLYSLEVSADAVQILVWQTVAE